MKLGLLRLWRWVRWPFAVLIVLYIGLVIYRIPHAFEVQKTQETVAKIHAQKLTVNDVDGKHLPPPPDPKLVDATVEGIDANGNGIRDDVELAIFKKYPSSPKTRAAELQYAMALQMEFANVFNSETLVAVIQQEGRGYLCVSTDARIKEVEDLVLNDKTRKNWREEIRSKYLASFSLSTEKDCDIDI